MAASRARIQLFNQKGCRVGQLFMYNHTIYDWDPVKDSTFVSGWKPRTQSYPGVLPVLLIFTNPLAGALPDYRILRYLYVSYTFLVRKFTTAISHHFVALGLRV